MERDRRAPRCSSPRAARSSSTGRPARRPPRRGSPDRLAQVLVAEDLVALGVDRLALLVDHVVELDDALADVEVEALDPGLGALDRLADEARLDRHVLLEAHPLHQAGDALRGEALHQVVVERQVEARRARVALAAGAAAELVVDPPAVVALGADDVQAAGGDDPLVVLVADRLGLGQRRRVGLLVDLGRVQAALVEELGGQAAGLPPSRMSVPRPAMFVAIVTAPLRPAWATIAGFLLVELGVEDLVLDAAPLEHLAEHLGLLDRDRADEDRPAGFVHLDDLVDQRVELALLVAEDEVRPRRRGSSAGGSGSPRPRGL